MQVVSFCTTGVGRWQASIKPVNSSSIRNDPIIARQDREMGTSRHCKLRIKDYLHNVQSGMVR